MQNDGSEIDTKDEVAIPGQPDTKGYYEVEDVVDRRIDQATHEEQYLVKFKHYEEDQNMWLPASSFKAPMSYATRSRSGRTIKRKFGEFDEVPKQKIYEGPGTKKGKQNSRQTKLTEKEFSRKTEEKGRKRKAQTSEISSSQNKPKFSSSSLSEYSRYVSPWGGVHSGPDVSPKEYHLSNTCTVDNMLSSLFLLFKQDQQFRAFMAFPDRSDDVCSFLHNMFQQQLTSPSDKMWAKIRFKWIVELMSKEVLLKCSSRKRYSLDLLGSEFDFVGSQIMSCALANTSAVKTGVCRNEDCKHRRVTNMKGLQINDLINR